MSLPPPLDDQAQTRLGMAALFVALVRSLDGQEGAVLPKVEAELEQLYYTIRNYPADWRGALEMLRWTSDLLRERKGVAGT